MKGLCAGVLLGVAFRKGKTMAGVGAGGAVGWTIEKYLNYD